MRKYLFLGLGIAAALILAGYLYYVHVPIIPPPPKDLTKILPKQLLDRASPQQLAVLRGDGSAASTATLVASSTPPPDAAAPAAPAAATPAPATAGLTVSLSNDKQGALKGQAVNATGAPIVYAYSAGTLFSNGTGDMVLLKDLSVEVPAKGTVDLLLPVAQTSSGKGVLEGSFAPHPGVVESLQPLVALLAHKKKVSSSVAQTATLIVNDDAPLDTVASFPRTRPLALVTTDETPFRASPADLIDALALIQEAGIAPANIALMSEPQLKIMTMLASESHQKAMEFFGITEQTQWTFWKTQLLEGDPSLRHYALYGIARYYPDVALQMLPGWVRAANLYRNYRLSAAWALALIEDKKAQEELKNLRQELQGDPGMRQAIDRALQHWESAPRKVASNAAELNSAF